VNKKVENEPRNLSFDFRGNWYGRTFSLSGGKMKKEGKVYENGLKWFEFVEPLKYQEKSPVFCDM
jgi:hypothetical protein